MNLKASRGFTLIEVLVSLTIMAIAFVAVWGLHYSSLSIDIKSRYEVRALDRANACLEQLRASSFPLSSGTDAKDVSRDESYSVSWTVTPYPGEPKLTNVDLEVTWTEPEKSFGGERTDGTRTLRLFTVMADLR
jgi:prepilin-type N-terminal cleavage/methylation domain-containing protein